MPSGIEVWRWRTAETPARWVRRTADKQTFERTPAEFDNAKGNADGDWLIVDARRVGSPPIRVHARDVPITGTIWRWSESGAKWSFLYKRSSGGHSTLPETLEGFRGDPGEILIDIRRGKSPQDTGLLTVLEGQFQVIRGNGEVMDVIEEFVMVEDITNVKADADIGYVDGKPGQEAPTDAWGSIGGALAPRQEAVLEQAMAAADSFAAVVRRHPNMLQEFASIERGESTPTQIRKFLQQILQEATPSPTPGTTAPLDWALLGNDYAAAAKGFDDQGSSLDDDGTKLEDGHGYMAADTAAVKLSTDLLASVGASLDYFLQLRTIWKATETTGTQTGEKQFDGEINQAAATAMLDAPKIVAGFFSAVNGTAQIIDKTSGFAASTSAVAQGMPFVGTAISCLTLARSVRKAHRARKRFSTFKKMLKHQKYKTEKMMLCLKFAKWKSFRKTATSSGMATTAVVGGSGGTILGVTAVAGGANIWNPVGWVLLGVAAVGGTGLVGYKVYRRVTRKKRHRKRIAKGGPRNAAELGLTLLEIARGGGPDAGLAVLALESFGVVASDVNDPSIDETVAKMVARHLKHM